eukprot:gnl/MRDRNA2_/MRDRNA2_30231_c0_seq1.p1 gnl/MRDRNA2_/MRDRNA2_30231_c0~~gnl/MRDRNA2_/MRDRNA2_30231_c0_seq1.p1  ORF type:complete len:572 (+),score=103.94 gnl/MRDRNA2_/MRDRNA2_30231_c0_seq1:191-1717(+)
MGPFPILMALGAHVVAIDLDRKPIWEKLIKIAKASPGTLTFPVKKKGLTGENELAENAGCNLLTQTPEIRTWLAGLMPDKHLVLGAYAYLDGPLFVRVSMAMDAIIADLVSTRKVKPALAYLCTPTDCHVCTPTSKAAAMKNFRQQPFWQLVLAKILGFAKMAMSRNVAKTTSELPIVDAIVKEQGPNYCLAKRLQHWRAIVSRSQGCIVSSNIAPSTSTVSVVSNKSFAMAYKGMHHFKPMEVSAPETSNAVMAALLINDLRNPQSAANPSTPLKSPMQLFTATSFHGGAWRVGYKFGCIGPPSVVVHLFLKYTNMVWNPLNALAWCGWCALFVKLALLSTGSTKEDVWEAPSVRQGTVALESLCCLEVVRMLVGSLQGNVTLGVALHYTRVFICLCVFPHVGTHTSCPLVLFAWSFTEICRYPYYILGGEFASKLRYGAPIVTFPLGAGGEMWACWAALPHLSGGLRALAMLQIGVNGLGGLAAYSGLVTKGLKALKGGDGKSKKE